MTKQDLLNTFEALTKLGNIAGVKFSYFVGRNINLLKPEVVKYNDDRKILLESCSEKDENGKLKTKENGDAILKDTEVWAEKIKELLEEEVNIDLYKININDIPDTITAGQLTGICDLIIGEPAETKTPLKAKSK